MHVHPKHTTITTHNFLHHRITMNVGNRLPQGEIFHDNDGHHRQRVRAESRYYTG